MYDDDDIIFVRLFILIIFIIIISLNGAKTPRPQGLYMGPTGSGVANSLVLRLHAATLNIQPHLFPDYYTY